MADIERAADQARQHGTGVVDCPECLGTGREIPVGDVFAPLEEGEPCPVCWGSGVIALARWLDQMRDNR